MRFRPLQDLAPQYSHGKPQCRDKDYYCRGSILQITYLFRTSVGTEGDNLDVLKLLHKSAAGRPVDESSLAWILPIIEPVQKIHAYS